ncbi:MAG: NAD(P)/FAD-dependent oxidoreductase [Candidatus Aenigmatarchaeota archaeon]
MKFDVIILGGGLTGLYVGYNLSKKGKKIAIIEKSNQLGGLLGSFKTRGDPLEKYYHHVFKGDKNFLELIKELGIDERFHWTQSTLGFYSKGKIYDLSIPFKIISFKPLNFFEKIRFGMIGLKIKLTKNHKELEKIPAKEWIIENGGLSIYHKLFYPLLKSKYGENLEKVSAAWFIERIKLRTKGGLRKEKLGYLKGGFEVLIKRMEEEIVKNGGKIIKGSIVRDLFINNGKLNGVIVGGKKLYSKIVVSTIPLPRMVKFNNLPQDFREKLGSIKYQGAVCVVIGMDKKLTDFYWINIIDDSIIGAIIEHTNFQPVENYKDHIIYLASYPDFLSDVWKLTDDKVFEKYFSELKRLFPEIDRKNVRWWKVFRDEDAGLVYDLNYSKRFVGNRTPIKGLIIGGMFNSYPERSIESCLVEGKNILNEINGVI